MNEKDMNDQKNKCLLAFEAFFNKEGSGCLTSFGEGWKAGEESSVCAIEEMRKDFIKIWTMLVYCIGLIGLIFIGGMMLFACWYYKII